jgi:hypothetical protein
MHGLRHLGNLVMRTTVEIVDEQDGPLHVRDARRYGGGDHCDLFCPGRLTARQ